VPQPIQIAIEDLTKKNNKLAKNHSIKSQARQRSMDYFLHCFSYLPIQTLFTLLLLLLGCVPWVVSVSTYYTNKKSFINVSGHREPNSFNTIHPDSIPSLAVLMKVVRRVVRHVGPKSPIDVQLCWELVTEKANRRDSHHLHTHPHALRMGGYSFWKNRNVEVDHEINHCIIA